MGLSDNRDLQNLIANIGESLFSHIFAMQICHFGGRCHISIHFRHTRMLIMAMATQSDDLRVDVRFDSGQGRNGARLMRNIENISETISYKWNSYWENELDSRCSIKPCLIARWYTNIPQISPMAALGWATCDGGPNGLGKTWEANGFTVAIGSDGTLR